MTRNVLPVILAGGSGTRLWPLSRELYPKQFLHLIDDQTMLQSTLARLDGLGARAPYIVCNEEHRFLVAEQCRELDAEWGAIILEPQGRNTAPAIALAALRAIDEHDDAILLVLPADHYIRDTTGFQEAACRASELATADWLVTFGIVPDAPETSYGYIRSGPPVAGSSAITVDEFVEKPDAVRAAAFIAAGGYYWNSGMFMFKARVYLEELNRFRPDIHAACERAAREEAPDLDFIRPGASFADCPGESIDFAVMERTEKSVVLPVDVGWSDVGSWNALWETVDKDENGNDFRGDVIGIDTRGTYIHADKRLVAAVGVDDLVVVETADAVLVARRGSDQDVKKVVASIRERKRPEHHTHMRVFRPWGSYETVETGPRYQVKRITVNPGASLSLQMHHHRSEHWIVVRGTATVDRDGTCSTLTENESTYIPVGCKHRLSNPGKLPLHLIEVQVGAYLEEDDIVRFDDRYGRVGSELRPEHKNKNKNKKENKSS